MRSYDGKTLGRHFAAKQLYRLQDHNIYIEPSLKAELQFFFIAVIEICLSYERKEPYQFLILSAVLYIFLVHMQQTANQQ